MAHISDQYETNFKGKKRINSEFAIAVAFNLAAWLVVGVIAVSVGL